MTTTHVPGESRTPTHPINDTDIPSGVVPHLLRKFVEFITPDIQRRIDDISKQFTGAGWKNLPQEVVDEIVGYLLDNLAALKACSLTCKRLFGAMRPLIHQRLVCMGRPDKLKRSPFNIPGAFNELIDRDRLGILHYTRHLALIPTNITGPHYNPRDIQRYLPHLRSITHLHTLTLFHFHLTPFTPVFDKHFGMFTSTLRYLDIRYPDGTERELLYIVSQFSLLEDLTIVSLPGQIVPYLRHPIPKITQSPPLGGNLALARGCLTELPDGLAAFPGGLNFRSLELSGCKRPQALLAACGRTATSVSYFFGSDADDRESGSLIQVDITTNGTIATPLDLKQNVVLERFEFSTVMTNVPLAHGWVYQTLRSITSPVFNEFVVWVLNWRQLWEQPITGDGWKVVDELLVSLAQRNPGLRVVFMGNGQWSAVVNHLPLTRSKGLFRSGSFQVENPFRRFGFPD